MGFYEDRVLPRIVDVALRGEAFDRVRSRVTSDLEGVVLEVGFGSGRNVPHYPAAVTRVLAVEPAGLGLRMAEDRISARGLPVDAVGLDGQDLSLDDDSVDHVLTTWTLCTIPDVARALAEVRRVLRPGGALHFAEHGRSPDPKVARWQDRLTPLQRRLAGGCHLNRSIGDLVASAGLELTRLDEYTLPGPAAYGYMYEGTATAR